MNAEFSPWAMSLMIGEYGTALLQIAWHVTDKVRHPQQNHNKLS